MSAEHVPGGSSTLQCLLHFAYHKPFFVSLRYDFEDVFHMIENLETRQLVESGGS